MISARDVWRIFLIFLTLAVLMLAAGAGIQRGILPTSVEQDLHQNPAFVEHDEQGGHSHTGLGDASLGNEAQAHASRYCGHSTDYQTVDGVLHKRVFLKDWGFREDHKHRWKGAHYMFTGTGYTRTSDWYYVTGSCY
jgi:hypothetical protein